MGEATLGWLAENFLRLLVSLIILALYLVLDHVSAPKLEEGAAQSGLKKGSATRAIHIARVIFAFVGALIFALVWGIQFSSVFVFAGTTITLLGVALFASWSILSNVSAYFVLLLNPAYQRGKFIRIIDVDNYIEGYIADITVFHTKLISEDREVVVYPNNLLLARPAIIDPRNRLRGIGKISDDATPGTKSGATLPDEQSRVGDIRSPGPRL